MLDNGTRNRIDNLRDTLVGVLPSPESQIEQITTGLIYKFMSDIDAQSVADGGEREFFVGKYEKYAFENLTDTKLGGEERVQLYSAAIDSMETNPGVPPLFREIFKNSFLKFRDPATLTLFIQGISEFHHSDTDLGDEFEYLLKFMAAQGAAGQFITPRNIVNFIVSVVNPQKKDEILDPACGTAGFLISAYKHIQEQNKKKLDAKDLMELGDNLIGYDISPDMTRISRVNLYLHGFRSPLIYDYDTLTDDYKWSEYYDVILANPPFMTPRSGIKPRGPFTVMANRAEVLFVGYIAEHLRPKGRAGVIVPEGIIFQSANSYKELRKRLVEDWGLYAVVSLPSGVFNPYSGVKTSILFLDRTTKIDREVLFVKVENDGYHLGAQRHKIGENNLPKALNAIQQWQKSKTISADSGAFAHSVSKTEIADDGEYNLTGERYREPVDYSNSKWEMFELKEILKIYQPQTITSKEIKSEGKYKVYGANGVIGFYDSYNHENSEVAITCRGATCGTVNFTEPQSWITGNAMVVQPSDDRVNKKFLFYLLQQSDLRSVITGAAQPQITRANLSSYKIPVPPLEVQEQIVTEVDGYQKVLDGAKQVVENWKPQIKIDPDWQSTPIKDLCDLGRGRVISKKDMEKKPGEYPVYSSQTTNQGCFGYLGTYDFDGEYVTWTTDGANAGTAFYRSGKFNCTNVCGTLKKKETAQVNMKYLALIFNKVAHKHVIQVGNPKLMNHVVAKISIPLAPLEVQDQIVAEIEAEQAIVEQSKTLIDKMEKKIADKISEVWG